MQFCIIIKDPARVFFDIIKYEVLNIHKKIKGAIMKVKLKTGEVVDIIPGSSLKIIQNRGKFSYGTDAILLSSFANIKKNSKVIDLGTGTGIIPLFLCSRHEINKVYGIEIQEEVADIAKRSVCLNGLEDVIEILHMDLKNLQNIFGSGEFQVVTSNPPYMSGGGGIVDRKSVV